MRLKPNYLISPRVFWISIVVSVCACLIFYILQEKERCLRIDIQRRLDRVIAEKEITEEKLTEAVNASKIMEKNFKRLKAIETALVQARAGEDVPKEFIAKKIEEALEKIETADAENSSSKIKNTAVISLEDGSERERETAVFWILRFFLSAAVIFLFWRRNNLDMIGQIRRLKSQLQDIEKTIEYERSIRKAVETASLRRDAEYKELELKIIEKEGCLREMSAVCKKIKETLSDKEKEFDELNGSFCRLKDILERKGLVKELTSLGEKGRLWILGESQERRLSPRLCLSRDFKRTIILRVETLDKSRRLKCLTKNISSGGLCFEGKSGLKENEVIWLRLFFYGRHIPMMKIRACVIWKRLAGKANNYGVSFSSLEEKNKLQLASYIEKEINTLH